MIGKEKSSSVKPGETPSALHFAEDFELQGVERYRKWARARSEPDLKNMLEFLANEEQKHYEVLKQLEAQLAAKKEPDFPMPKTLSGVSFASLTRAATPKPPEDLKEMYETAIYFEKLSMEFYAEAGRQSLHAKAKDLFALLVKEETKHRALFKLLLDTNDVHGIWTGLQSYASLE